MRESVAVQFPFCPDPLRDQAIRPVVQRALAFLLERVGATHLEAIILTGSLARGEGSVLLRPNSFRLLGDVELLVILQPPFNWPETRRRMVELSRQATREIGKEGRLASIEYGPAGISYLQRTIRPCIFAYDLFHHGKVVWGRTDILGEIKPFGAEAIPREDAVKLIMNRMVELLIEVTPRGNGPDSEAHAYRLVKTTLDLAGSALAFAGEYVSPYGERQKPFDALFAISPELKATIHAPKQFQEELEIATHCKLAPTVELLFRDGLSQRVTNVLAWTKGFWLWEMRRLLGHPSGRFPELLEGYLRREPLRQHLKGWIKYLIHPLRPRGGLALFRVGRLLPRASPQTLIYAAALLACDGMVEGREDWEHCAASLLPVPPQNGDLRYQVGELWRWLVRNN